MFDRCDVTYGLTNIFRKLAFYMEESRTPNNHIVYIFGKRNDDNANQKNDRNKDNRKHGKKGKGKSRAYYKSIHCDNITHKYICSNSRANYKLRYCGGCKLKWYCSAGCQKYHWKHQHRWECGRIQERLKQ